MANPEYGVYSLGYNFGRWRWQWIIGFPDDSQEQISQIGVIVEHADALGLSLSADEFSSIVTDDDIDVLVRALGARITSSYGSTYGEEFEVGQYGETASSLITFGVNLATDNERKNLALWAANMLERAGTTADSFGVEPSLIDEADRIILAVQELDFSEDAIHALSQDIRTWNYGVRFALRGIPTPVPTPTVSNQAGTDITQPLPIGSSFRGEILSEEFGCSACHLNIPTAPKWKGAEHSSGKGIAQRAEERWQAADYKGQATSAREYLIESIILPDVDNSEGSPEKLMPWTYGKSITKQELADVVAFLLTIE